MDNNAVPADDLPEGLVPASDLPDDAGAQHSPSIGDRVHDAVNTLNHWSGLLLRGGLKGVLDTVPAVVAAGGPSAMAPLMRKAAGQISSGNETLLNQMGLPAPNTDAEANTVFGASLLPGAAGGAMAAPEAAAADAVNGADTNSLDKWWKLADAGTGKNQAIGNAAVARDIGVPGETELTPSVLARARALTKAFLDLGRDPNKNYVIRGDALKDQLQEINDALVGGDNKLMKSSPVKLLLDKLSKNMMQEQAAGDLGFATDFGMRTPAGPRLTTVTGEDLGNASSQLNTLASNAADAGKYPQYQALRAAKEDLEDIIEQGLSPRELDLYQRGKSQYRYLTALESRGTAHVNNGDVNLFAYARHLSRTDPQGWMEGANNSATYQVTRLASQQLGKATLMEKAAESSLGPSKWLKGPRMGISLLQSATQDGLPSLARGARNVAPSVTSEGLDDNERDQ